MFARPTTSSVQERTHRAVAAHVCGLLFVLFNGLLRPQAAGQQVEYYKAEEPATIYLSQHPHLKHDHFVVAISAIPAIVIRAKAPGESPDAETRARETTANLRLAFQKLRNALDNGQESVAGFTIENCNGSPCIDLMGVRIIRVTKKGDVIGYKNRDLNPGRINEGLVAEFWRAQLQDIALLLNGQEPTTMSQYGVDLLRGLHQTGSGEGDQGDREAKLRSAINSLDPELLRKLVFQIPSNFVAPTEIPRLTRVVQVIGSVRDQNGQPVAAAKIVLRKSDGGLARAFTADSTGKYVLTDVGAGTYDLVVEASGFKQISRQVIVVAGRDSQEDFRLEQSLPPFLRKVTSLLLFLAFIGCAWYLLTRIRSPKHLEVTLALEVDGVPRDRKTFTLERGQELCLDRKSGGGVLQWILGSPERVKRVNGTLYLFPNKDAEPVIFPAGAKVKLSGTTVGDHYLRVEKIKKG
jgi:hypothetical protein